MVWGEQARDGKMALGTYEMEGDKVRKCEMECRDGSEAQGPRAWCGHQIR